MSDTATSEAPDQAPAPTDDEPTTSETTEPQGEVDWKSEARKWEERAKKDAEKAKANAKAAQELEEFKRQSMSETERAIDEARTAARREALVEAGGKVAAAELRAAATGRMTAEQLNTLIDGINLARFIDENGEVDQEAVTQFVDGIAPQQEAPASPLDLGQGARGTGAGPAKTDMDSLLRAAVNGRT